MLQQLLLLFLLFVGLPSAFAQGNLANSHLRSPYTYIYRLTDPQALKIYEDGPDVVKSSFFHTVVDSFAVGKAYNKPLAQGHYLYLHAQGPDLVYWLETKSKLQAKLLHLQPALALMLHDSSGRHVTDAQVWVGRKQLKYDTAAQSYRLAKSPKKGILRISYQGFTFYEELASMPDGYSFKPAWWRRVLNTWPIRYTWWPVRDVYRTIRWGEPQGWVRSIVSIFNEDFRRDSEEKYKGYLVTNKPHM